MTTKTFLIYIENVYNGFIKAAKCTIGTNEGIRKYCFYDENENLFAILREEFGLKVFEN